MSDEWFNKQLEQAEKMLEKNREEWEKQQQRRRMTEKFVFIGMIIALIFIALGLLCK